MSTPRDGAPKRQKAPNVSHFSRFEECKTSVTGCTRGIDVTNSHHCAGSPSFSGWRCAYRVASQSCASSLMKTDQRPCDHREDGGPPGRAKRFIGPLRQSGRPKSGKGNG